MKHLILLLLLGLIASLSAVGESIRVVVVDGSGAAVVGAKVEASHAKVRRVMRTGPDGSFLLESDGARDASWTVRVSADGFAPATVLLNAPFPQPITVRLRVSKPSEEISISARRAEAEVSETAEAITLFDQDRLRTSGAFTLDDQLRQSPGFNLFRRTDSLTANPTSQGVSFRGTGASGASRALVLADGVPLNDPFGGWVYWDRIPRAAVGHIELLQGGASQLYGSAALSGVIEVITRKPSSQWLVLESSGGTRNTPEGSAFAGKDFGKWSLTGSGSGYSTGGSIPTPAADRGTVDVPADSRDANGELSLSRNYDGGSLSFGGLVFHESRDNGTPLQTNATDVAEGTAHWAQKLRGGSLTGIFFGSGQTYDQSFSSIAANRNSEALTRLQHVPAQRVGGSLQWSNSSNGRQQWTFGTDAQSVHGSSLETGFTNGHATVNTSTGGTQRSLGVFAQDTLRLNSRLIFTAGLRLDHWSNLDAAVVTKTLSTGTVAIQPFADRGENFLSPHASLLVRLSGSWALTFAGSRAFRAPTLNELYRSFRLGNVLTNANSDLVAEQLYGGEAGVVGNIHRLSVRATAFAYQIQDPVSNVTLSVAPTLITRQRKNLGETASRGFELSAGSEIVRHWSWKAGYQFTHAVLESFPADLSLIGRRIPQVPAHSFTFQSAFERANWSLSAQGRASGNQFDDDQNAFALGRAFTLDAMLAKHLAGGVTFFVAGTNLTNDRYLTALTPTPQEGLGIGARAGIRIELSERSGKH